MPILIFLQLLVFVYRVYKNTLNKNVYMYQFGLHFILIAI